jgi:hypothetical protein
MNGNRHRRSLKHVEGPSKGFSVLLMTKHEIQGEDMGPFQNMPEGFTGRLYDEIGKQTDRGTCRNFICNIDGHRHRLRVSFYRYKGPDHYQNKLKLFVWVEGPELKPSAQTKLKSCTKCHDLREMKTHRSIFHHWKGIICFAFHGFSLFSF